MSSPFRPKRVLWITTDHQRWDCVGANGNPLIRTPVLDRLAAGGVSFDNLFVQSPLCMPSRASFMTGLYPSQTGVTCNGPELPQQGVLSCADMFAAAHWKTAQIGKLHFQCHEDHDLSLQSRHPYGFQYFCPSEEPGCYDDAYMIWLRTEHPEYVRTMKVGRPSQGGRAEDMNCVDAPAEVSHAGFCANQTMAYLRRHGDGAFIHMGIYAPHPPLNPPQDIFEPYRGAEMPQPFSCDEEILGACEPVRSAMQKWKKTHSPEWYLEFRRYFYAMCTMLDGQIGRVIKQLEDAGELDDTLILVHSDHGDMAGDHHLISKGHVTMYPEVLRVPAIIHWPKGIPGGKRVTGLVEALDLLPTLGDLCGAPMPRYLPGRSLAAGLRAGNTQSSRQDVYAQYGRPGDALMGYVRTAEHSLVRYAPDKEMLFNLKDDPHEFRNIAADASHKGPLAEMRDRLLTRSLEACATRLQAHRSY